MPAVVAAVSDGHGQRLEPGPRGVGIEVRPVVRIRLRASGGRRLQRRVVVDELGNRRRRNLVVVPVVPHARAESPVVCRTRDQIQVGREDARLGLGRAPRQRQLRQRRVDRERLKRFVVAPRPERDEACDLRAARKLREARGTHGLRRVGGPERHAPTAGGACRVSQAQRAVPLERVIQVVEPRTGVGHAKHLAVVRPLGAEIEVVGPRVVRQRDLDVVAEPETGAPRELADVTLRGEGRGQVERRPRRRDQAHVADVASLLEIELRGDRHIRRQSRLGVLDPLLCRIVEEQRAR